MKNCEVASALPAPYSSSFGNPARSQGRAPIFRNMTVRSRLLAACAIIATATPALAQQQPVTFTFEGMADDQVIGSFYGSDYEFSPNTLVSIDRDAGGVGDFANEPSPNGVMYFVDGASTYLNVINGFQTGLSFFYSSGGPATVRVYDGLNATGNILGTIDLVAQFDGNNCTGDPGGFFCNWSEAGVSFAGTGYSADFSGSQNLVAFDNLTLGSATPWLAPPRTNIITTHSVADVTNGTVNPVFDSGTIIVSAGDGAQQTLTTNLTVMTEGGAFSVDRDVTLTASGNITDYTGMSGTIFKTGTGTLILAGTNSYTGGTMVLAGLLSGTTTSLQGAIRNEDKVEFKQASNGTYAGVMSGEGQLIKNGAGYVTLTGANTYTGGTLVSQGRLLGNTTSLQGAISGSGAVEFRQDTNGTYAGAMSGGVSLEKAGDGTLTLTGANSYAGGTIISGGRLVGNTTSLQGDIYNFRELEFAQDTDGTYAGEMTINGTLIKSGAGTLTLTGENSFDGGTLVSAGRLIANTTSLEGDIINGAIVEFAQATNGSYTDEISGTGQFIKTGIGTLTLRGANSYTGGTLVSAGRLTGNTTSLQGAIVNNAQVEFAQADLGAYAGAMSGTGQLIKTGAGTMTLTGANSYTGGTLVWQGKLVGDTTSLQGDIVNNAAVEFAEPDSGTYAGAMSGSGQLIKTGYGSLTLGGANSYTGGTAVTGGTLIGNATSLQGAIVVNDGAVQFAQDTDGTYAGIMSGSGALVKAGAGTLTLTGANSYTGSTLVAAGRLTGNTTSLQGDIYSLSVVEFAQDSDDTYTGEMSGSGSLIKTGAGTLTLTRAHSYSGGTLVSAGRLTGNTTSLQGAIVNNAQVEFAQADLGAYAGAMSGTGQFIKTDFGTLILTGANTYSGGTLVLDGRLVGDATSLQGDIVNNTEVEFAQSTDGTYAGAMSGTGGLIKVDAGTLTLTSANSYRGGTYVLDGRLVGNTISLQGDVRNNTVVEFAQDTDGSYTGRISGNGQLIKTGAGTLTLTGANRYTGGTTVSAGRLAGNTSSLKGAIVNNAELEFAQATDATYAGVVSGTGQLIKTGAGTLTLTGAHSYSGGTFVSGGRLVGNTTALRGDIVNNAAVEFAEPDSGTYAGAMSGSGQLIKTGYGSLTLGGANSYTGGTAVTGGTLIGNTTSLQGAIVVNDGAVQFAQDTDGTYAGIMSGSGALVKAGAGTLTLTGANSYTGSTLVAAGRLTGDTTSLQGDIYTLSVVEFAQDSDGTYAREIGGGGSLVKSGAGTLTLKGAQSYSGGTTVSAGRLAVDTVSLRGDVTNDAELEFAQGADDIYAGVVSGTGKLVKTGAGMLVLTGANNYTGGSLVSAGRLVGDTSTLQGAIENNAIVEFVQGADGTYTGAMSGTGQFVKTGAGNLTLTGESNFAGSTFVAAGRLTGNAMSLKGAIVNDSVVEFAQSNAGTYAGAVSGSGALVKTGAGTLTLTGAHSYSGGTLVSAGRLAGDTTSLQGVIMNDAAVEFSQATDGIYSGDMGGSGAFYKSGAGTLTLAGITSITGAANVSAGWLKVAGQLAAESVTVQNTATLSGNGVIGGNVVVQSGGSLAPGASPGTLSVIGNVSFLAGSNFGVEIDGQTFNPAGGAGSYDLLQISGTANLAGTIAPSLRGITGAATNSYVPSLGDSFLVLSAGTITGNFNDIAQPTEGLSGLRFDAVYGGDSVRLVVTPGSFAQLGNGQDWNRNVSNAASGIDSARLAAGVRNGTSQTLFNGLYGMNANQLEIAFGQISGEVYASSLQSVTETERSTFSSVFNALCNSSCGTSDGKTNMNGSVWGRYISKSANHAADQSASGYNSSSSGLLMGATLNDSNDLQFGVAASYVESKVATSLGASTNSNSTGGYLYLNYTPTDQFNFSSVLGASVSKTHISRSIGTAAGRVSTNSETKNTTMMYGAKASYRGFVDGPLSLWADAGLELSDTSSAKIDERAVNTDFALVLDKTRHRSAETQLSARLQLTSDGAQISLSAGSVYELGDHPSMLRKVELGAAKWTVRSADKQRHGIRLGMQSCAQLSKRVSLSASYQHTNQGNGYSYDRANVGLNFAF